MIKRLTGTGNQEDCKVATCTYLGVEILRKFLNETQIMTEIISETTVLQKLMEVFERQFDRRV